MKHLLLISPLSRNSLMGKDFLFRLPCLALLKVAALTPPDWQVTIIDEKIETLDLDQKADLVGITTMTTTVQRGYEIADHFRQRGAKVNHVVYRPRHFTPDQLWGQYQRALKAVYAFPSILKRLWGTTAWKNFFYPMNLGFRQSVSKLAQNHRPLGAVPNDALQVVVP
jgi:hypothetical protein